MIKDNFNAELDELRDIVNGGKTYLAELEKMSRKKPALRSLKSDTTGCSVIFMKYLMLSKSLFPMNT